MDFNNRVTQTGAYVAGSVMSKLLSKVFLWMTIALGITGLTSMLVYNSSFVFTLMQNPMLMWGLVIAELIMVIALSAAINKISFTAATLMFIIYSILNGVMLSSIFLIYTQPLFLLLSLLRQEHSGQWLCGVIPHAAICQRWAVFCLWH